MKNLSASPSLDAWFNNLGKAFKRFVIALVVIGTVTGLVIGVGIGVIVTTYLGM